MTNEEERNDEVEIDVVRLLRALWRHAALILIVGIIFSAASVAYARSFVSPQYEANALFYVNNSAISLSNAVKITSSDLYTSSALVDTYVAILESRANMELVLAESGAPYSYETLRGMVSAKAVNSTGLFTVTVRSTSPEEARTLANVIADILPGKISDIMANCSVEIVDYAVTPRTRVSPSYIRYALIGMAAGMLLVSAIVIVAELMDDVIHDEDYLLETYHAPLLATIPNINSHSRRYGYSKYKYEGYATSAESSKDSGKEKSSDGEK